MSDKTNNIKNIATKNSKGQYHGYQQWYWLDGKINYRGNRKNGEFIGYQEHFGGGVTNLFIK